jgi:hypothetical protein
MEEFGIPIGLYKLIELALILPLATALVERILFTMKIIQ